MFLRRLWNRPVTIRCDSRAIRISARHAVYTDDLRRDFDYWHGAVEAHDEGGIAVVDYSHPAVHRLLPSGDLFHFIGLPEHEATTAVFLDTGRLTPGELVLDIGAYCGATAVAFARAVAPTGHVLAFDPDPAAAAACRLNVSRHVPGLVTVIETGVWANTGTVKFVAEGNVGSAVASVLPRRARTLDVPVLSLADATERACAVSGLHRVAFIKLNVEGSEVPILEGGLGVLRAHRPRLVVEPHPDGRGGLNTDRLEELLAAAGYHWTLRRQGSFTHPVLTAEPT
jgi:FkbM family methyltransferase